MLEENWEQLLIKNVRRNINYVLEKYYESNQAQMAKEIGIRPNTLFTYISTDTKPPITFIYKLCSRHNLSIDMFLRDELAADTDKARKRESVKYFFNKYNGSYYTYFLVVDSNSLKEGLVQEGCMDIDESGSLRYEIYHANKQFSGILSASDELIYFDLKNSREKIHLVIKNPGKNIKEKYLGGMGIAAISSPEDNRIPCAQKIIISRTRIPVDQYYRTLSEFLQISTYFKIKKRRLIELLGDELKIKSEQREKLEELLGNNKISMEDKLFIGERELFQLQKVLEKEEFIFLKKYIMQNNNSGDILQFNSLKINLEEDKMIYRFIKNEFKQQ